MCAFQSKMGAFPSRGFSYGARFVIVSLDVGAFGILIKWIIYEFSSTVRLVDMKFVVF